MTPVAVAKRPSSTLSHATLVPFGFVLTTVVSLAGFARWVGSIDTKQQTHDLMLTELTKTRVDADQRLAERLKELTTAVSDTRIDAAATRARVEMLQRDLDRRPIGR